MNGLCLFYLAPSPMIRNNSALLLYTDQRGWKTAYARGVLSGVMLRLKPGKGRLYSAGAGACPPSRGRRSRSGGVTCPTVLVAASML